ncbi:uncharacterized protein LOC124356334 isoform X3 [Homalodisca vitripennis]|uniref:uncharacterized protein LOC124356334 isoform X1 n=1 Tax=Homalodisca vitripennis TaxID=197043 RepID=UPI001EE9B997|nr:uncharacterized protein LOC124356334 isoform X1 [Homalodisca vitripennis]XP_046663473.1 uncharacterized protein LOC124356334 isoform X2 [Homalodisca vitripennis]XP_046663474.1 uncharacterized protein LOC124356334 isoform X3 [Homalodisca vitripennis]
MLVSIIVPSTTLCPTRHLPLLLFLWASIYQSDMNFPALSIASASAWTKRRPVAPLPASVEEEGSSKDVARYMNTYRLEAKRPFNAESVRPLLREILTPGPGRGPLRAQQHQQVGGQTSRARSVPRSNSSTSTDTR